MEYVYFIKNENNNLIKIGRTSNLERRFKELKSSFTHVGDKSNLLLLDYIETEDSMFEERQCHKHFNEFRETGEWFNITIDMIEQYKSERKEKVKLDSRCLEKQKKGSINLNNKLVWNNGETTMVNYYGNLGLQIVIYLEERRNCRGLSAFTLENMITTMGYTPNKTKGRINDKVKNVLAIMRKDGLIESTIDLAVIKPSQFVEVKITINNIEDNYFPLPFKAIDGIYNNSTGIEKGILLSIYCYISARIKRLSDRYSYKAMNTFNWDGMELEITYFKVEEAERDLKICETTWYKAIKELKKLGLIDFGNIGCVTNNAGHTKIANNVYCVDSFWLDKGLKMSKKFYNDKGYRITDEEIDKKNKVVKAGAKARARKSYLKKKIKNGSANEQEVEEFKLLGGNMEEVEEPAPIPKRIGLGARRFIYK